MGVEPAEDFADDVFEERGEEAEQGDEGADDLHGALVRLLGNWTGGGAGCGKLAGLRWQMRGAEAVAQGAAVAAFARWAEIEARTLLVGCDFRPRPDLRIWGAGGAERAAGSGAEDFASGLRFAIVAIVDSLRRIRRGEAKAAGWVAGGAEVASRRTEAAAVWAGFARGLFVRSINPFAA